MWYSVGSGDTTQQQRCSTLCVWYSVGSGDTTQCTTQYSVCVYSTPYGHKVSVGMRSPRASPAPGQVKPSGLPPAGGWKPCGLTLRALGARLRAKRALSARSRRLSPPVVHLLAHHSHQGIHRYSGCWWVVVWYRHTVHLPGCAAGTVDPCWSNPADPLYTLDLPPISYPPAI